jgi:hypothetical protein
MIRPTMSHALNKENLYELMSNYASHLEKQLEEVTEQRDNICNMIIDASSADPSLIPVMFNVWLNYANQIQKESN